MHWVEAAGGCGSSFWQNWQHRWEDTVFGSTCSFVVGKINKDICSEGCCYCFHQCWSNVMVDKVDGCSFSPSDAAAVVGSPLRHQGARLLSAVVASW